MPFVNLEDRGVSLNPEDQPDYVPLLGRPEPAEASTTMSSSSTSSPPIVAVPEHSHAGESASNGAAENAVKLVEGQCRTLKAALEDRLSCAVPEDHGIMHWLPYHSIIFIDPSRRRR